MFFNHGITVTVNHREIDRNGDWTVVESYLLAGCAISNVGKSGAGRTGEQDSYERDTVHSSTVLFAPADSDIRIDDTIVLNDGTTWHVWGLPTTFGSPFTGWTPGMQAALRLYKG